MISLARKFVRESCEESRVTGQNKQGTLRLRALNGHWDGYY